MYRLDGTVGSIIPGKLSTHIAQIDFGEEAPLKQYLFHRLRPHGISIIHDDNEKGKDKKGNEDAGGKLHNRKRSHQPGVTVSKRQSKNRLESGYHSSNASS